MGNLIWHGIEREGPYKYTDTLFVRGGKEHLCLKALELCANKHITVDQIYFGAGTTLPDIDKLVEILDRLPKNIILTIEVPAAFADLYVEQLPTLHYMITTEVVRLPTNVTLKLRNETDLVVSTKLDRITIENTPYEGYTSDIVLITEDDERL